MKREKIILYIYILLNFILFVTPYFLTKKGNHSRNVGVVILVITSIIWILINKEKFTLSKGILIASLGFIFFMMLSLLYDGNFMEKKVRECINISISILLILTVSQIKIDSKFNKYFPLLMSIFLMFPVTRALIEWKNNGFLTTYRVSGDNWPSIFPVEIGLLIFVPLIFFFFEKNKIVRLFYLIVSFVTYISIVITQTRMVIVLIPLLFLCLAFYKNYKIALVSIAGIILILGSLFFFNNEKYLRRFNKDNLDGKYSTMIRMEIYKRGLDLGMKSKFLGIGFQNYQYYSLKNEPYFVEYVNYPYLTFKKSIYGLQVNSGNVKIWGYILSEHLHNNYLEILVTQGIFSFLFYISFIFIIFKNLLLRMKNSYDESFLLLGFISLGFICIHGILEANLYILKANQILYLFLGFSLNNSLYFKKRRENL